MTPGILVQVDRINELSKILLEMTKEHDNKKFWELDRKFKELKAIHTLEDELNEKNTIESS